MHQPGPTAEIQEDCKTTRYTGNCHDCSRTLASDSTLVFLVSGMSSSRDPVTIQKDSPYGTAVDLLGRESWTANRLVCFPHDAGYVAYGVSRYSNLTFYSNMPILLTSVRQPNDTL